MGLIGIISDLQTGWYKYGKNLGSVFVLAAGKVILLKP